MTNDIKLNIYFTTIIVTSTTVDTSVSVSLADGVYIQGKLLE